MNGCVGGVVAENADGDGTKAPHSGRGEADEGVGTTIAEFDAIEPIAVG